MPLRGSRHVAQSRNLSCSVPWKSALAKPIEDSDPACPERFLRRVGKNPSASLQPPLLCVASEPPSDPLRYDLQRVSGLRGNANKVNGGHIQSNALPNRPRIRP